MINNILYRNNENIKKIVVDMYFYKNCFHKLDAKC